MTFLVDENDRRARYVAIAAQTIFDIDFPLDNINYIVVYKNGVIVPSADYTVNLTDLTVTLDTGAALNDVVVLEGLRTVERQYAYPLRGDLSTRRLNAELRGLTQAMQELRRDTDRTLIFNPSESDAASNQLPLYEAGKVLQWDGTLRKVVNGPDSAVIAAASENAAAAEASAAAAAASYDSLDDRYLGAKAADPSVDNDGNALITGASYFNTSVAAHKYWNGASWQLMTTPATPDANLIRYNNTTSGLTATQVQAAIDELKVLLGQTNVTGDVEPTFRTSAKTGWIFLQGQTLGSASSGASLTGTTYQPLYEFIWNNIADTYAPVSSGRGGTAAADFAANKAITLPDARGRALFGAGQGTGLSGNRAVGQAAGAETVTLAEANLPAHTHGAGTLATASAGNHSHAVIIGGTAVGATGGGGSQYNVPFNAGAGAGAIANTAGAHTHNISGSTGSTGSGTAFAIIPPILAFNIMIKL
jgi:microcystin-dependent protein